MKKEMVLLPRPMKMQFSKEGSFLLAPGAKILVEPGIAGARAAASLLAEYIGTAAGFSPQVVEMRMANPPAGSVVLAIDRALTDAGEEGYVMEVTPGALAVRAAAPGGLFQAVQTIRQMLPVKAGLGAPEIPCLTMEDRPRFPWRGYHLDCCRHFMQKDFVKRYIDLIAYHKLNRLHWHLTEDQGWRVEISGYPKLSEVSAWRDDGKGGRYGGIYSKDDIREIVAYATARGIVIVPEIEMPGHCQAALAAYPELSCTGGPFQVGTEWGVFKDVYCAGNDKVFEFLEGVLAEVVELFPGKYVHIGADEVPKDRWKECPKCQARIKREKLKDEFALQTWFVGRMARWLQKKGKTVIAWDEILEGGAPKGVIVQAWRGHHHAARAAAEGSDIIVSPYEYVYFDYDQKYFDLRLVHSFDPVPPGLPAGLMPRVLGTEGLLWTEGAPQELVDSKTFPRLCGVAEVGWSPVNGKDWPEFQGRCRRHSERLKSMGVEVGPEGGEGRSED